MALTSTVRVFWLSLKLFPLVQRVFRKMLRCGTMWTRKRKSMWSLLELGDGVRRTWPS